jgi:hypothetical protein
VASIPNDAAVLRRLWAPGLEEGFVPQGLAVSGRHVFVVAYRSTDPKVNEGLCRVFRIEAETGKDAGFFDMPAECEHSGGLAFVAPGMLVVSDTYFLWQIDVERALASGTAAGALRGSVKLGGTLRGHFLSFDGTDLWIGIYTVRKEAEKAKLHRLPLKVFDEHDGRTLDDSHVAQTLPSPPLGQGMAFEGKDRIWIAASSSQIGWIHVLDRATGQELKRFDTIIGIEGIAFDARGKLWAVSEAGAKKYLHWKQHFPVVFQLDTEKLR